MDTDEIFKQIEALQGLPAAAKEAARRIIEHPENVVDEQSGFEGLTGPALDTLYSFAYQFYLNAHYKQAKSFFYVLTTLDMLCKEYWMGLAASQQMTKQLEQAITTYDIAAALDNDDPFPHFHAAECYFSLNDSAEAMRVLDISETLCSNSQEHQALLERIGVLKQTWTYPRQNDTQETEQ